MNMTSKKNECNLKKKWIQPKKKWSWPQKRRRRPQENKPGYYEYQFYSTLLYTLTMFNLHKMKCLPVFSLCQWTLDSLVSKNKLYFTLLSQDKMKIYVSFWTIFKLLCLILVIQQTITSAKDKFLITSPWC
jgi:hypothetical protein